MTPERGRKPVVWDIFAEAKPSLGVVPRRHVAQGADNPAARRSVGARGYANGGHGWNRHGRQKSQGDNGLGERFARQAAPPGGPAIFQG